MHLSLRFLSVLHVTVPGFLPQIQNYIHEFDFYITTRVLINAPGFKRSGSPCYIFAPSFLSKAACACSTTVNDKICLFSASDRIFQTYCTSAHMIWNGRYPKRQIVPSWVWPSQFHQEQSRLTVLTKTPRSPRLRNTCLYLRWLGVSQISAGFLQLVGCRWTSDDTC